MGAPKPISVTYTPEDDYEGNAPQPFVIVGEAPAEITPQAAPEVDSTPADAAAVASDLQDLVDALVAAGVLTGE